VTLLPACGAGAHSTGATSDTPRAIRLQTAAVQEPPPETHRDASNDYVVGPFVEGDAGVRTYYLVRN
jgi:hypothetical protein